MTRKNRSFMALKDILADLFQSSEVAIQAEDLEIWRVWDEAMGQDVAPHARPWRIREGTLRVVVADSIRLQDFSFRETELRDRLNRALGENSVRRMEFRLGHSH